MSKQNEKSPRNVGDIIFIAGTLGEERRKEEVRPAIFKTKIRKIKATIDQKGTQYKYEVYGFLENINEDVFFNTEEEARASIYLCDFSNEIY
jgi:hypothetical protein